MSDLVVKFLEDINCILCVSLSGDYLLDEACNGSLWLLGNTAHDICSSLQCEQLLVPLFTGGGQTQPYKYQRTINVRMISLS